MARYMTQDQIAEYRECFSYYDKKRNQLIRAKDLSNVMRSLGLSPTPKEIDNHLKGINKKPNDEIDFAEFLTIMHDQQSQEDPVNEILQAFKISDPKGKGKVPASYLRTILMKTGEKFSAKEVEQIFRAGRIDPNGNVSYNEFVKLIMTPLEY